ncbi:hypothetical protein HYT33_04015 [Candidatus Roizmanbacteria bacterium]|nr:hypothetical protein [Candidatus Roizmanbacteria bacterium]
MSRQENSPFLERDLGLQLVRTAQEGACCVKNFLNKTTVAKLQDLCSLLDFEEIIEQHEKVEERYFIPRSIPSKTRNTMLRLSNSLRLAMARYAKTYPVLQDWSPSDFSVQLYDRHSYITSHRDHKINKGLVVIFTIQGEAIFKARNERHGSPFLTQKIAEGDVVLLRGGDFVPNLQGHPGIFHSISGALTEKPRISIGFRDKIKE